MLSERKNADNAIETYTTGEFPNEHCCVRIIAGCLSELDCWKILDARNVSYIFQLFHNNALLLNSVMHSYY